VAESLIVVSGSEWSLVEQRARERATELVGEGDPSMMLESFFFHAETNGDDRDRLRGDVAGSLATPPFIVERRVVLVRFSDKMTDEDVQSIVAWAQNPTPAVHCVVAIARAPKELLAAAGEAIALDVGWKESDHDRIIDETLTRHRVTVKAGTVAYIRELLGDDIGRVAALAETLSNIYGSAPIGKEHIEPYIGGEGSVPEWDLTDAIEKGQVANAIHVTRRIMGRDLGAGNYIVNILTRFYLGVAAVDAPGLGEAEARAAIGPKATPTQAKKRMKTLQILGSDRAAAALDLVLEADRDVKGRAGGMSSQTVVEVLVARLARLHAAATRR
jgi:DNA polymerase III delta subunit